MKKMLLIILIFCMLPITLVRADSEVPIAVAIIDSGIVENNPML